MIMGETPSQGDPRFPKSSTSIWAEACNLFQHSRRGSTTSGSTQPDPPRQPPGGPPDDSDPDNSDGEPPPPPPPPGGGPPAGPPGEDGLQTPSGPLVDHHQDHPPEDPQEHLTLMLNPPDLSTQIQSTLIASIRSLMSLHGMETLKPSYHGLNRSISLQAEAYTSIERWVLYFCKGYCPEPRSGFMPSPQLNNSILKPIGKPSRSPSLLTS